MGVALVAVGIGLRLVFGEMSLTGGLTVLLLTPDVYWPLRRIRGWSPPAGSVGDGPARPVPRASLPWLVVEKLPLLLPVAASAAITMYAQQSGGQTNPLSEMPLRFENAAVSYVTYLRQTFWPRGLVPFYPYPDELFPAWQVAGAVALLAAVSALAVVLRRRAPYLAVLQVRARDRLREV